jgi:hypothetical protein
LQLVLIAKQNELALTTTVREVFERQSHFRVDMYFGKESSRLVKPSDVALGLVQFNAFSKATPQSLRLLTGVNPLPQAESNS